MKLKLAYYSEPVLRKIAERVEGIDDLIRTLVNDMIETMVEVDGIGLAAPQVFQSLRLFIACPPIQRPNGRWEPGKVRVYVNPEIISSSEEIQTFSEGCLSIPNFYMKVTRPQKIKIKACDLSGEIFEEQLEGFSATNFLHEYDHLNGVLIVDYYTQEQKKSLQQLLEKGQERT